MLSKITLPQSYNYIGVFLTLRCNLGCSYCINNFGEVHKYTEMSGTDWARGLARIVTRPDLPMSLQGGEPTMHEDFYDIVALLCHGSYMDLLTNGLFDLDEFMEKVDQLAFRRPSPYANIRFSFHTNTNEIGLAMKVRELARSRYRVGIWGLAHPDMKERNDEMVSICKWLGIDFRLKEYLDSAHGNYLYPDSISGVKSNRGVLCRPSELLIAPDGRIFRCHSDLYAGVGEIGHILDKSLSINDEFKWCFRYGLCNPCDVKIKTNRMQQDGHTSVKIKFD